MYGADLPLDHVIQLLHEFTTTSSDAGTTESELNQVEIGNVTIPFPSVSSVLDLYHSAAMIRPDLLAINDKIPWPPLPKDLCEENIIVPSSLYNLLA